MEGASRASTAQMPKKQVGRKGVRGPTGRTTDPMFESATLRNLHDAHDRSIDHNEPPAFAKKSSSSSRAATRETSPVTEPSRPQAVLRSKNTRQKTTSKTASRSAMGPPSTTPFAGPSRAYHSATNVAGPSRITNPQHRETPTHSHPRTSLPLPSPTTGHRSRTHVRKVSTPRHPAESSSVRRLSVITASTPEKIHAVKSTASVIPFWQLADGERAKERGSQRPLEEDDRPPAGFDFIKRKAISTRQRDVPQNRTAELRTNGTPRAYLGRNFKLRKEGEPDDSDEPMDEDIPDEPPRNTLPRMVQMGVKAARKREWPQPTADSPETSDDSEESPTEDEAEIDELESDDDKPETDDSDIQEIPPIRGQSYSPPEIIFLDPPPRTVKMLAESPPPEVLRLVQQTLVEPSEELINAIETLSLSSVRMQKTKQLPFLLRNLRTGFESRCRSLDIPTESISEELVPVTVRYIYSSDDDNQHVFETQTQHWICPLCELHGVFQTREMLASHLSWDHDEVDVHWEHMQDRAWLLEVMIRDTLPVEERRATPVVDVKERDVTPPPAALSEEPLSPFPFVALSPPEPRQAVSQRGTPATITPAKFKPRSPPPQSPTPSARASTITSSRARSTTVASTTTTTTTATAATASTSHTERPSRYPTPPPASNPLGPSAQPPYLPAKSEYGGPDIHYSCRPGGACLFDLLNTLSLEPFGVLAWDILDREDEIYDSDNVRDEYKVMHALWARWIVLNRNTFVADYYKGTIAFVNAYWRMIHRAAGWDALRYWLLMLLANRFINGNEVARILKHYEGLTGMDSWYD
ncbi:hypothetical protein Hypma_007240 [Hypsizygus marmoreus]|uniref:Uncharacterized protein n=1 Tax=Hypsizygus marmoreus TaxID=39966 RepID=A0A369K9R5_HYPMA|nr:hypothetical protein Hypma_007240 [Hypsizygus marmoreus]